MANAPPSSAVETGLKVLAVDVPASDDNERRTRDGKWTLRQLRQSDAIVPLQSGTNAFDSQRGMTGFGTPRDVKGKHLKRIWELEFPEEAIDNQAPVNAQQQQQQQVQQPQTQMYNQQQAYNQQRPGFNAQRPAINGQ